VTAFQAEVEALARPPEPVDLGGLLIGAIATVRPLADAKGGALHLAAPPHSMTVAVTPGVAQEMLTQILSALVQQHAGQVVVVRAQPRADQVEVRIAMPDAADAPSGEGAGESPRLQEALLMAQLVGLTVAFQPRVYGAGRDLTITFPAAALRTLLVVEDNPGISELYRRFLQGSGWQPVWLADPAATCARARELQPAAILLDVLMPEVDGWTVLQALRTTPEVAHIPVIVASVVNDPELAQVLGAAASLRKPLSRPELLAALDQATRVHSGGESGAPSGR
jgi:CheY-like chemotaxis protein